MGSLKFATMKLIYSFGVLGMLMIYGSCASNKAEDLPKTPAACDTLNMGYAEDIASIFEENRCLDCHSQQTATAGIILDNFQGVADNAEKVLASISWPDNLPPGKQMPIGGPKVSQCEIDQFAAWISQGKNP